MKPDITISSEFQGVLRMLKEHSEELKTTKHMRMARQTFKTFAIFKDGANSMDQQLLSQS